MLVYIASFNFNVGCSMFVSFGSYVEYDVEDVGLSDLLKIFVRHRVGLTMLHDVCA